MPDVSSHRSKASCSRCFDSCATMATEIVEVATESEEDVIINCVAIFYEQGKEGENFIRAVRFNNRLLH